MAKVAYDKHTVIATAENGTVTGAGEYTHGDTVTLTATANEHYVFVNWTKGEEVVAETAEYTFAVEADVELVANFKLDSHTVAATAENGTVTGAGEYTHGTEVTLTATPAEGYEFVNWTAGKDTVSTEATYTFTVEADVNLVANFQEVVPVITHTVTWYTAVRETTEVTLGEGAAITKPATDPEMEGYVFMGWTNECFVAEDGSDFAAIEDFGTADADKEYYAVFAVETTTGGGGDETGSVTMQYSGSTTTNMSTGNNAEIVGLDANEWSVVPTKGNANNMPGLNKDGDIRLYGHANGGNYLTISSKSYTITDVTITYTSNSYSNGKFYVNDNETAASNINANEFVIKNANSGTTQVRIKSLVINYTSTSGEPTTTYSNYMTTCTPEEYTIEWSVNGKVTETTTVVEGDALVLPEAPEAPEACGSKVFMGWATTSSVDTNGTDIKYVDNQTIPTGDATYYAVFAKTSISDSSEDKEVTLSIKEYAAANGWVNGTKYTSVVVDENVTATVSNGSNTGKYYTNGNEWRIYQSENATLTIAAKEGCMLKAINVIYNVGNTGTLLDAPSGIEVEVEAESVTFKVGNTKSATNGQVKITAMTITYNAGEAYTYSEYSTTCSGTGTDVENIEVKGKSVKMIVNGQLIIIKNGVTYNAQGQVVK